MTKLSEMAATLRRAGYIVSAGGLKASRTRLTTTAGNHTPNHLRGPKTAERETKEKERRKQERLGRPSDKSAPADDKANLARLAEFAGLQPVAPVKPPVQAAHDRIRASLGRPALSTVDARKVASRAFRSARYADDTGPAAAVKLAREAGLVR